MDCVCQGSIANNKAGDEGRTDKKQIGREE